MKFDKLNQLLMNAEYVINAKCNCETAEYEALSVLYKNLREIEMILDRHADQIAVMEMAVKSMTEAQKHCGV